MRVLVQVAVRQPEQRKVLILQDKRVVGNGHDPHVVERLLKKTVIQVGPNELVCMGQRGLQTREEIRRSVRR